MNSIAQTVKRLVARALNWHVREQVEFNRAVMGCVQATIEALNESNRAVATLSARIGRGWGSSQQLNDIRTHWSHWRVEWEKKLAGQRDCFLEKRFRTAGRFSDITSLRWTRAFANRCGPNMTILKRLWNGPAAAIQKRSAADIEELQKRFWADLDRIRLEYESIIHAELRTVRQKASFSQPAAPRGAARRSRVPGYRLAEVRRKIPRLGNRHQTTAADLRHAIPGITLRCSISDAAGARCWKCSASLALKRVVST